MEMTIYHNPDCGTSRNTLELIRKAGVAPTVVEYLKTPLGRSQLQNLAAFVGLPVRDIVRERGTPFNELGLGAPGKTEDDLLDAMATHPILVNRPIVTTNDRAVLCRPSDAVLDLLPKMPAVNVVREDGTPILADREIAVGAELTGAMADAGLADDGLEGADRTYYRYTRLDGEVVGYGGFEVHGTDALLRSMAVTRRFHRKGNGRNLALLLMNRAFGRGARLAYAQAQDAEAHAFLAKLGFTETDRGKVPPAMQAAGQHTGPARSAPLLARRITL